MQRHAAIAATALACLTLTACDDDDPTDPGPALPIIWTFDAGLDGWTPGSAGTATGGGSVETEGGEVVLLGWGDPGEPNAWITRTVALPAAAYTIRVHATADCFLVEGGGDTALRIRLTAGNTTTTLLDWTSISEDTYDTRSADLEQYAGQTVTLRVEMDDEATQEEGPDRFETLCIDEISIIGD